MAMVDEGILRQRLISNLMARQDARSLSGDVQMVAHPRSARPKLRPARSSRTADGAIVIGK